MNLLFVPSLNSFTDFSQSIREAIEEIIDQNGVPDVSSLKDICEFSSDVYPDLPTYYDIIANYIISYWSDNKRLPEDNEIQNHIMNTLQ